MSLEAAPPRPTVHVVDDDASFRDALARLLRIEGFQVAGHGSAVEFLAAAPYGPGCVLLDVNMPHVNGLELQLRVGSRDDVPPIIFLTGNGDIPASVRAIKAGAEDFLTKPVDVPALLAAIARALARDAAARAAREQAGSLRQRLARLTPRELEVFHGVVRGELNKQIAFRLGAAERTIKAHRRQVMLKLEANSVPDLVHLADQIKREG